MAVIKLLWLCHGGNSNSRALVSCQTDWLCTLHCMLCPICHHNHTQRVMAMCDLFSILPLLFEQYSVATIVKKKKEKEIHEVYWGFETLVVLE